jgi:hypothetical protein
LAIGAFWREKMISMDKLGESDMDIRRYEAPFRQRAQVISPFGVIYDIRFKNLNHFERLMTLIIEGRSYGLNRTIY